MIASMRWLPILLVLVRVSMAQPSDAERLFREGLALIEEGKPVEACEKFEQSIAKDPQQVGVLMNLGRCNERRGKIATALRYFQQAYDRASDASLQTTREQAQQQIAKLAPQVPVIIVKRASEPLPGEKLVVDDLVVAADQKEIPLDPGRHSLVLTAPGRVTFETSVAVRVAERKEIKLPPLEVATTVIVAPSARPLAGKITTAAGGALTLGGLVLGLYAKRDYDSLFEGPDPLCGAYPDVDGKPTCDEARGGQARAERDRRLGIAGMIVGGVGLAVAATGLFVWLTAPDETSRVQAIVPIVSDTAAGLAVTGRF